MIQSKHDKQIAQWPDRPVSPRLVRELEPVTQLRSEAEVTVVNGVLIVVRTLQAA